MGIAHSKVSAKTPGSDPTLVDVPDWNADHAITGVLPAANLGSGTPDITKVLRGDGSWATMSGAAVNPATLSDLGSSGEIITATAGQNVTIGQVSYLKSDGKLWLANANSSLTLPGLFLPLGSISANASGSFLARGFLRADALFNWTTVGGIVYVDISSGGLTQTPPSSEGNQVQVAGYAWSADILYFYPMPFFLNGTLL